jgi:hypothetical protein
VLTPYGVGAAFPTAWYTVLPNGTAYEANISIENATGYDFYETGPLGERVPIKVSNVRLTGPCDPCAFNWTGASNSAISFPKGSYWVHYQGPIRDYHLQGNFDRPYLVEVAVPGNYDLRNPLLGMISPGGKIIPVDNTSLIAQWNGTRSFELRFYDEGRVSLLYLFGNFWIVIAIVLLMPFVFSWMRKRQS